MEDSVDPVRDLDIITNELRLKVSAHPGTPPISSRHGYIACVNRDMNLVVHNSTGTICSAHVLYVLTWII